MLSTFTIVSFSNSIFAFQTTKCILQIRTYLKNNRRLLKFLTFSTYSTVQRPEGIFKAKKIKMTHYCTNAQSIFALLLS